MPAELDALNLTADDQAMLTEHAETVQTEAKRKFSLKQRLSGIKMATAKIVLFTDPEAVEVYARKNAELELLAALIAEQEDVEVRAEMQAEYDAAEPGLEELRATFLESALAVHMRAVPQAAIDAANRDARKAYALKDGTIPEDVRERYYEMQNHALLGKVIVRIVDAHGAEAEMDPETLGADLQDTLPPAQYQRLIASFNQLVFNDTLASQATADPGF